MARPKGFKQTEETKAKISAAKMGVTKSEETKAKMSVAKRAMWAELKALKAAANAT